MKNKLIKYIIILLCIFCIFILITHNKLITQNIILGFKLWITKVFPSLFPMFIINDILIEADFPIFITNFISKISKNKLKSKGYIIYVFIMSVFSGTPTNAIILKKLVEKNLISSKDASIILSFTFFSNPLFLFNMLTMTFSQEITIKIIIIHYFVNGIIYFLFKRKISSTTMELPFINNKIKLSNTLNNSIKKSLDNLIMILGTITFYIIISTILVTSIKQNITNQTILKGLLELTQGLNNIQVLNISNKLKEIIAISIISFGGLSIHSQVSNIISEANISYKYFFIGRVLHIVFSIILIIIF